MMLLSNQVVQKSKYLSSFRFCSTQSTQSKFNELDLSKFNIESLSKDMIDQLRDTPTVQLNGIFSRNGNVFAKMQNHKQVDQVYLCSELLKYNEFVFNTYLKQFYRVRIWNRSMYDSHFISIQLLASNILHDHFVQQDINIEFVSSIPSQLIKQDISQLFGIYTNYKVENTQLIERSQLIMQLKNQYEGRIQFYDFIKQVQLYYYENWNAKLQIKSDTLVSKTCDMFLWALVGLCGFIEFLQIAFLLIIIGGLSCEPKPVQHCYKCLFRKKIFFGETNDFKYCANCEQSIKEHKELSEKSNFRKIWDSFSKS